MNQKTSTPSTSVGRQTTSSSTPKIPGIQSLKTTLADGSVVTYHYHRASRTKLPGAYGSQEFLDALQEARRSVSAPKPKPGDDTLAGLLRAFQQRAKWRDKLAESTKKEYRRVFDFWEKKFGKLPTKLLAAKGFRADVLAWHDEFSGAHPREADNRVIILAGVLAWAAADRTLAANVLTGFERAYSSDRSEKIWLPEHVEKFLKVASPEMQLALMLALHTGQRQADIRGLAWSNYDGQRITLRQGKSARMGRQARLVVIPCTKALKATLDALPKAGALILTTKTGRAFQKRYFAECWDECATAAGIVDLHFHDIRGTTITMLFEAGCSVAEAASITGHTLRYAQSILDKYLARTSTLASAAILKFENRLGTSAGGEL